MGLIKRTMTSAKLILKSTDERTPTFLITLTGFIFGFSVAVGLGLNQLACLVFAVIAALGVLAFGSLATYLLTQTIVLAGFAVLSQVAFRLIPDFRIEVEVFQVGFLFILTLTPALAFVKKFKNINRFIAVSDIVQLVTSLMFAVIVQFLRSRMPADALFSLKFMYSGEDNAGVVAVLAESLKFGYTPHVSLFGEFFNSIYIGAAGAITWFGNQENLGLLTTLTHFNMSLLFMAWIPLASLSAIALSGIKFKAINALVVTTVMTTLLSLLFWPSISLGHTSVISSGLLAMCLTSLMLNRDLALKSPLFFAATVISLAFVVGTTWFPLMPFSAASVALTFAFLLHREYLEGRKKSVLIISLTFVGLSILLLPQVLDGLLNSSSYLNMAGGTRNPGLVLPFVWISMLVISFWLLYKSRITSKKRNLLGAPLFMMVIVMLTASNFYLLVTGIELNSGSFGYGATKYFLTSITFSLPVFWMLIAHSVKDTKRLTFLSVAIVATVLAVVADTRVVPATILAPNSTAFLSPEAASKFESSNTGVYAALSQASGKAPDHLFCVSDYGFPVPGEEENLDSYMCTRWGQSITGDESGSAWRFVPLNRQPIEELLKVKALFSDKEVIVIRLTKSTPPGETLPEKSDTWWGRYVEDSWDIVTVTN
jgi:hypothetical protein